MTFKLVVSLTTTPQRLPAVGRTIKSILKNTIKPDAIFLHLPEVLKRTGQKYPAIPEELTKMKHLRINRTDDIGPATKLLPITQKIKDGNTYIVVIDDDVLYPKDFIESLLTVSTQFPNSVITGYGYPDICSTKVLDKYVYSTCMCAGFAGYMLQRSMLNGWKKNIPLDVNNLSCFLSDDLTISNHFLNKHIPIIALKIPYLVAKLKIDQISGALHLIDSNFVKYSKCAAFLKTEGILNHKMKLHEKSYINQLMEMTDSLHPYLLKYLGSVIRRKVKYQKTNN